MNSRTSGPPVSSSSIRTLLRHGDVAGAAEATTSLIREHFGLSPTSIEFTLDEYSLNSVSGRVYFAGGDVQFFKFHQEDGEEANVTEYYLGQLLADAGLPVDVPLRVAGEAGRQIVLYELRTEPRMADVCFEQELARGNRATLERDVGKARRDLDRVIGEVAVETLTPPTPASAEAAIHQLFHRRLTDENGVFPGGRYESWYATHPLFTDLLDQHFVVNGVAYAATLRDVVTAAHQLLAPATLARQPVVTAHGDDHQGNVWVLRGEDGCRLRLFDPAFAARTIPALLAPVKATFHNVFAHPFWLYHPDVADERITVEVARHATSVTLSDDAPLSPLRREILDSLGEHVWGPLLAALARRGELPPDWRSTVRAALLCCPLLVTNLVDPRRSTAQQYLALGRVIMLGSEPEHGSDDVSQFLDAITPR